MARGGESRLCGKGTNTGILEVNGGKYAYVRVRKGGDYSHP